MSDQQQLDAMFEPIAPVLEQFARVRHLHIDKYRHEAPIWSFIFRHPGGGVGKIDLTFAPESKLDLAICRWHDDYDKATRRLKSGLPRRVSRDPEAIQSGLEAALSEILGWSFTDWDRAHDGNDSWREYWSREEFERFDERYPYPAIH